jgi:hypothetical protein
VEPPAGDQEELRKAARKAALKDARARMFEYIANVPLPDGGTIGEAMRRDRELALAIQQRIEDLEPTYRFNENDVCEASVTMDMAEIQRLLDENRRGGWFGWS